MNIPANIEKENEENNNILNDNFLNDSTAFLDKIKTPIILEELYLKAYTSTKKILIIIIIISVFILYIHTDEFITLKNITDKENFTTKLKAKQKGRKYLDQCLEEININNQKFEISLNPKITMIIPVYNTGEILKKVVKSIQNQNMQDIEIILANDFSNDNITLDILEKLKEEDPRIVVINNKKNMGILYSRSISVLQARGEYITNLDHDDFIFDEDVFDTSYKSAKNGNFDIISFMYVASKDYYSEYKEFDLSEHYIPHNYEVYQPQLSFYTLFVNEEFSYFDYTIWAKIYKNNIYKKAIDTLTYERYSMFVTTHEDIIGIFVLCNVANSYKFIRKIGVYHKDYPASTSHLTSYDKMLHYFIIFADIVFDLSKNQDKKYAAIYLDNRVEISNDENNKNVLKVINKIMNCDYIEQKYKDKIKNKFGKILGDKKY